MKKFRLLLMAVFSIYAFSGINTAYGFSIAKPVTDNPVAAAWKYIKASEFVKLSAKDFSSITGKKLNFFQRLSFSMTKAKMKHDLKKNPDLKITDYIKADSTFQIDILWLILGFIVGLGVILGYVTHQEKYRITSAWIGFGLFLLGVILFHSTIF